MNFSGLDFSSLEGRKGCFFFAGEGGDGRTILRGNGGELVVYKRTVKTDFQYEGILRLLHS